MSRVSNRASRPCVDIRGGLPGFEALEARQLLASLVVTNANDSGAGSFRQAILDANTAVGPSKISFDIPGAGLHKIADPSGLPLITVPVDIDARTQPGYAGSPLVEIDGMDSLKGPSDTGLSFVAGSTGASVEGLAIVRFYASGIEVLNQNGVTIRANDIGYDPSGGTPSPGNSNGIYVGNSSNVIIGGPAPADGNLVDSSYNISGVAALASSSSGISLEASNQISIQNNLIGTDPTLTALLGNAYDGIYVGYGTGISILSNTIANNGFQAIDDPLALATTSGNVLINNGTNLATLLVTSSAPTIATSEGKTATVTYTITNTGPQAASHVLFHVETSRLYGESLRLGMIPQPTIGLPPISLISVGSVTPSQGTVNDAFTSTTEEASVSIGSLANGASATVTVVVNAYGAGTDGLVTGVSSDQFTLVSSFAAQTSTTVTISGRPDLAVVALPALGTAKVGVPYTFAFVVTNHDTTGQTQADFEVINTANPSSILDSVTTSVGADFGILGPYTATPSGPFPFSYYSVGRFGRLAPGALATVLVTITPTQPGPLIVLFATSPSNTSSLLDVNPADNLAYAGVPALLSPKVVSAAVAPNQGNIGSIAITFDASLNPKPATNLRDYTLTTTTTIGKPSTIGLRSVQYNSRTHVVTLNLSRSQSRQGTPLKLVLSGLTGTDGSTLLAGSNVVMVPR